METHEKQRVIVYVDGFNFYYGLKSSARWKKYYWLDIVVSADGDMIPAIEIATQARQRVFVYFPPNQYSSNLATMSIVQPVRLERYEKRFRESLFPDTVHLSLPDYDLSIPQRWKLHQTSKR